MTTRKKPWNASAYASTTNAPPNMTRSVPSAASVMTGMSAASTPTDAIRELANRERSGQIRSAIRTTRIVAVRTSSGAIAWKSTCGFTYSALDNPWTRWVTGRSVILNSSCG